MDMLSPEKRYCKVRKRKTKKKLDELRKKTKSENKENTHLGRKHALSQKYKKNNDDLGKSTNITNNLKIKNLTKDRINIKHGLFAKGARSETFSRIGLSEEFKARSEGNLNKIIDLANGRSENMYKPTETINMSKYDVLKKDETIYHKEMSLISMSDNCDSDNFPDIQIIDIKPMSPIFKSIPQKIMCDNSVCHISPIKFSPNPKKDITSKTNQVKKNYNLPEKEKYILGQYAKMYEEFAKNVPQALKKYLPPEISDSETNLQKFLNDVYSRSSKVENDTRNCRCRNRFAQNSSTIKSLSYINAEHVPVILNPMQYLKRVNGHNTNHFANTKRDNINFYMDSLYQSKQCRAPESAPSNSKYMESLTKLYSNSRSLSHNTILVEDMIHSSPEEVFIQRVACRSFTPQLRRSSNNISINKTLDDNSPDDNMRKERSIYDIIHNDDMFSVHEVEDTPEPVFFPRRVNCD